MPNAATTYVSIDRRPDGRRFICQGGLDKPGVPERRIVDGPFWATMYPTHASLAEDGQWLEVAPAGAQRAGDIGGDIQRSEAYARRYARALPDGTWAVIDDAYYTTEEDGTIGVQNQVTYTVCADLADPGSSETWSDSVYEDVTVPVEADDEGVKAHCNGVNPGAFGWDGVPFHSSNTYTDRAPFTARNRRNTHDRSNA